MITGKIKYAAAEFTKGHPWLWLLTWNALPMMPFLLPHDKSYYGFRHFARPEGGLFLDVGANLGMSAAGFLRLLPNYRVFSIEADRHHEPSLQQLKKKIPNLDYLIVAAGATFGELRLHTPIFRGRAIHAFTSTSLEYLHTALERSFSKSVVERLSYDEQLVKMVPLDSLELKPDIVKIDVEGHDYEALLGLARTIELCRPCVMVEYNPGEMSEIAAFFLARDYRLFVFQNDRDVFVPFDEEQSLTAWETSLLQVNVFAAGSERPVPVSRS
jgi:FkbM family methyltransferase